MIIRTTHQPTIEYLSSVADPVVGHENCYRLHDESPAVLKHLSGSQYAFDVLTTETTGKPRQRMPGAGRPSISEGEMTNLQVRVPVEWVVEIEEMAAERGISKAEMARQIVLEGIKSLTKCNDLA